MAVRSRKAQKRAAKKPARSASTAAARKAAKAGSRKSTGATSRSEVTRLKRALRAARDRQAASAEILRAIASSPGDAQRSLQQIAETTERLFAASAVTIRIAGPGDEWSHIVNVGEGAKRIAALVPAAQLKISGHNMPGAVYRGNRIIHLPDLWNVDAKIADWPGLKPARAAGSRSMVGLPLRREGEAIGSMIVHRTRVAAFADDELSLLQSFADQAVIAIENARLFKETREALERQTATTEILTAINASTGDLQPVFDAILTKAHALCGVEFGSLQLHDSEFVRAVAVHGLSDRFANQLRQGYRAAGSPTVQPLLDGERYNQFIDAAKSDFPALRASAEFEGLRTILFIPLRKEGRLLGFIAAGRREVRAFSENEIGLLESFAAQAALAIENARLFNETREALERQTATADILKVIASSPSDLQPVFDAIAERSNRLIGGHSTAVFRFVSDDVELVAFTPVNPEADKMLRAAFPQPVETYPMFQLARDREIVEITDAESENSEAAEVRDIARARGFRSLLLTTLHGDRGPIGLISVTRKEPGAFAPHHVQLLRTFADQAVIAIQNVKLFDEVQAKTRDLEEALEQQTGSANILRVIASSPTDVGPVLQAIVESACELCDANDAVVLLREGAHLRFSAHHGPIGINIEKWPLNRNWSAGRAVLDRTPVHVRDMFSEEGNEFPDGKELSRYTGTSGIRSILSVPLLREGEALGAILLRRTEMRPFAPKQIALLQTFADQAVIAIGNVGLFDEVQAKTLELEEALVYQTGSANILKVIASSPTNVQPVLQAIAETACELCDATDGQVLLREGDELRFSAHHGSIPVAFETKRINRDWVNGRAVIDKKTVHAHDLLSAEGNEFPEGRDMAYRNMGRTVLSVPLLRDNEAIGTIALRRAEAQPFSDKQIALLQTFADQAVIAIQNVKLFDEVQARTRELEESLLFQTASAEVLKVISRSPDSLQPVLDVIVDTSRRLCGSISSVIFLIRDGKLHVAAHAPGDAGKVSQSVEYMWANPVALDQRGSAMARAARERRTVHIADTANDPEFSQGGPLGVGERRALLSVPLMSDGEVIGGITLRQSQSTPFTPRQIELIQTFADQAVIAISNVNLFEQVQQRTRELTKSLNDLRTAQDRLVQTEKLASLGQLTAGIAHEIKNPLNFVNNFAALSSELIDELLGVLEPAQLPGNAKQEVGELTHLLKDNLDKVVQHGRRADSIVKNMLLHSRAGAGERRPVEINGLVEESLNLAYHGARAEKSGFNITLKQDFDPDAGLADVFPQEITRVFLNLISNGFYAAAKRKAEIGDGFEPMLSASTKNLGETIEIRIRDNGTGIPPDVKDKMFNPFFTTKPAGEGTGLGLSISHDIIVKQHGGTIGVETESGQFTEFTIVLPRISNQPGASGGRT